MEVKSSPAAYSSAHDDLIWTVYDAHSLDTVTYPNYKYIGDMYVDSVLVARIKKVQDPTTNMGIFNVGQVVRNYLSTTFSPTAGQLVAQALGTGAFSVQVMIKFGEEYGYTNYLNALTSDTVRVFNHYNTPRLAGASSILTGKANKLATARPAYGSALLTSAYFLIPYFPTTSSSVSVDITTSDGGAYSTSFTPTSLELQVLNLAPQAINSLSAGLITSATRYYDVEIGSETFRVNVVCEAVYDPYMLHFLNRYGGFESMIFPKVSRNPIEMQKKDFSKLPYTVDAAGAVAFRSGYVYNEGVSVYSSQYREKTTLNTDLLTDAEHLWLQDLVLSPMVYLQDGDYFYPVKITENNYEPKKAVNDDVSNLTVTIEYGYNLNAQYR